MKFQAALPWKHGDVGVDAVAAPATVPPAQVLGLPTGMSQSGLGSKVAMALEGAGAETVTFDVYVLDEATEPVAGGDAPFNPAMLARRRFYRVATGVAMTNGILVVQAIPMGGPFYIRVTADAIAGGQTRRILFAALPTAS